ncbi:MAG: hypothetical protein LBJ57_03920 [Prevotellaceae bacterium]|jgi:nitrite reductase/ring-hydroxylating ferredoxin subunit|nr:hypothetical protein [Prevotellaceae bacterium]
MVYADFFTGKKQHKSTKNILFIPEKIAYLCPMLLRFFNNKKPATCLAVALLAIACTKEYECPVPNVGRFEFDVLMPAYEVMKANVQPRCGYNNHGVIVYRYNNAPNEVFAFDATCPNSEECLSAGVVEYSNSDGNGYGVCKKCKSRYSMVDGRHTDKRIKLRTYFVQPLPDATDWYHVHN